MDKRKFNFKLFTRLVRYVKPYKVNFLFVSFAAVLISFFSIFNQYLLKIAVDDFITPKDYEGLVTIISIMLGVLLFQVTFQGHIIEQIQMIKKIIENGFAYEKNGSGMFFINDVVVRNNDGVSRN